MKGPDDNDLAIAHKLPSDPTETLMVWDVEAAGVSWDAPVSLDVTDAPPFPVEALPRALQNFVVEVATATQTPVDLPAMLVLSTMALTLAKRANVVVRDGYMEPLNLYTATALPPANRKSAVYSKVTEALVEHERLQMERMAPLVEEAASARRILEARRNKAEKRAAEAVDPEVRDAATQEAADLVRELATTEQPVVPRLIVSDITMERLAAMLREQGGRLGLFSPEGEIFAILAGRYGDGVNLEVLLKSHAGDDLRVERVGRQPDYVREPALTLGLTVQPDVIRSLASKREFAGRGLLGRFLYSVPRSMVGRRHADPPPLSEVTARAYHVLIKGLLDRAVVVDADGVSHPHSIHLSAAARAEHLALVREIEPRLGDGGDLSCMSDWAGKLAGAVVRIAGLLHAAHLAPAAPWDDAISGTTMAAAVSIGRYLIEHARVAYSMMGELPSVEDARHVLRWIVRYQKEQCTVRDAYRPTRATLRTVERVHAALELLAAHGYVRPMAPAPRSGPGRPPSPEYAINPAVHAGQNCQNCQKPKGYDA